MTADWRILGNIMLLGSSSSRGAVVGCQLERTTVDQVSLNSPLRAYCTVFKQGHCDQQA